MWRVFWGSARAVQSLQSSLLKDDPVASVLALPQRSHRANHLTEYAAALNSARGRSTKTFWPENKIEPNNKTKAIRTWGVLYRTHPQHSTLPHFTSLHPLTSQDPKHWAVQDPHQISIESENKKKKNLPKRLRYQKRNQNNTCKAQTKTSEYKKSPWKLVPLGKLGALRQPRSEQIGDCGLGSGVTGYGRSMTQWLLSYCTDLRHAHDLRYWGGGGDQVQIQNKIPAISKKTKQKTATCDVSRLCWGNWISRSLIFNGFSEPKNPYQEIQVENVNPFVVIDRIYRLIYNNRYIQFFFK